MPRLSVWMVRTALLYLGGGFTVGALLLANKGIPFAPVVWSLLPLHIEMVLIGWIVQLAMGVAYWILPRWGRERRRVIWAIIAFAALNIGVITTGVAYWTDITQDLLITGRLMEILAVGAFAIHAWPRIKPLSDE